MKQTTTLLVAALALVPGASLRAQSLRGSPASMARQDRAAQRNDYTLLRTPAQVRRFVKLGLLVRVAPGPDLGLRGVSYPYARPALKLFLERLAAQYHRACGERLVVTSLTRPIDRQPENASDISVHPAGMAADLHRSDRRSCRSWLESALLELEGSGVLEATRERHPPHYHLALFSQRYDHYVARLDRRRERSRAVVLASDASTYRVQSGDTLWDIARAHDTSVQALKRANDLHSSRLRPGQVLEIPSGA